jgi:DNA-binding protein YbaB
MNDEDLEYFASLEMRTRTADVSTRLGRLTREGVRAEIRADAGWVAVNAYGVVIAVELDRDAIAHLPEQVLGRYVVAAVDSAKHQAQRLRRELLAGGRGEH